MEEFELKVPFSTDEFQRSSSSKRQMVSEDRKFALVQATQTRLNASLESLTWRYVTVRPEIDSAQADVSQEEGVITGLNATLYNGYCSLMRSHASRYCTRWHDVSASARLRGKYIGGYGAYLTTHSY